MRGLTASEAVRQFVVQGKGKFTATDCKKMNCGEVCSRAEDNAQKHNQYFPDLKL